MVEKKMTAKVKTKKTTTTSKPKATATTVSYKYSPIAKRTYELETKRGSKAPYRKKTDSKTGKTTYLKGFKETYSHKRAKAGAKTVSKRK